MVRLRGNVSKGARTWAHKQNRTQGMGKKRKMDQKKDPTSTNELGVVGRGKQSIEGEAMLYKNN